VLFDAQSNEPWCPLAHLGKRAGRFSVIDAPVGSCGVLGFEFGYSLDYPEALVVWEAQYGDLVNVAQVFIDQFVTSSEDKWHRLSGLTLLLPHGYCGEGPEQSSARVERFLTQCAEENIQVCYPSTPAQLFHLLRRQVHRKWRKPLVVFTPNSVHGWAAGGGEALARDSLLPPPPGSAGEPRASVLADLSRGGFRRTIPDQRRAPRATSKVLLCTGKVYADLVRRREEGGHDDVAIVRLEQLYPQDHGLAEALAAYPPETPLVWVQEEPRNYGPWYWVRANLADALHPLARRVALTCVSRPARGSPATGSRSSHAMEQTKLVDDAFAASPTGLA
jgi:2-oxoglutarate dehydrogenase E1 component